MRVFSLFTLGRSRFIVAIGVWLVSVGWSIFGQTYAQNAAGVPTTVQQPVFGVAVSPEGVMEQLQFAPPGGELFRQRAALAEAALDAEIQKPSGMRMVSLARLQEAIKSHVQLGQPLPDDLLKLAGLQRIEYIFAEPARQDIVIAGPAQGWILDADERAVGMFNRRPVMLLEDLLTALRIFRVDQPREIWVGCSIGPTADGMARFREFQRSIPRQISPEQEQSLANAVWQGIEQAIGDGEITVFSISPRTNMAKVMIEADYRMKLIAIGREPPPVAIPVFFEQLKSAPPNNFQRWWFTPNYRCLEITQDRLAMRISGQGVKLGTEEYRTDGQGRLVQLKSKPLPAAKLFADSFTKRYSEIAAASPVFGQLRNSIDLLIAASYIQREELLARTGLDITTLLDPTSFDVESHVAPKRAKALANVKWDSGTMIAPTGGVSILASDAFREDMQLKLSTEFKTLHDRWWWDH
jgi:hypothetical protein